MTNHGVPPQVWRKTLLSVSATVRDAIRSLNESGLQIALVVSGDDVLVGTITDGDIRRGLLGGLTLEDSVTTVIQRDPIVVPPEADREAALQLMRTRLIRQLPVVDGNRRLAGLHLFDEMSLPERCDNCFVIMAGGRGRRLQPHTDSCPKPLLPVRGRPLLEHILDRAKADGFHRFIIAINYLGEMIEEYFGDGRSRRVEITYLREQSPLGTAGAMGLLAPRPTEPIMVANGDVLTDIRYGEMLDFHVQHGATATMAVRPHEWQHPFGVVRTRGLEIVGLEEKPVIRTNVSAGIYVVDPRALAYLRPGVACDMPELFQALQKAGERTVVYPTHESWVDIGRPDDYESLLNSPE